jgi:hypothetical protein
MTLDMCISSDMGGRTLALWVNLGLDGAWWSVIMRLIGGKERRQMRLDKLE